MGGYFHTFWYTKVMQRVGGKRRIFKAYKADSMPCMSTVYRLMFQKTFELIGCEKEIEILLHTVHITVQTQWGNCFFPPSRWRERSASKHVSV